MNSLVTRKTLPPCGKKEASVTFERSGQVSSSSYLAETKHDRL